MQTYRQSILPVFAIALAILGISYSACNDSKADSGSKTPAAELRQEINRFELKFEELSDLHEKQVGSYASDMGCAGNSNALEIINTHQAILDHLSQRLQYHKLQLIQSDTTNTARNKTQLIELKKDIQALDSSSVELRTGLDDFVPTHVTK